MIGIALDHVTDEACSLSPICYTLFVNKYLIKTMVCIAAMHGQVISGWKKNPFLDWLHQTDTLQKMRITSLVILFIIVMLMILMPDNLHKPTHLTGCSIYLFTCPSACLPTCPECPPTFPPLHLLIHMVGDKPILRSNLPSITVPKVHI